MILYDGNGNQMLLENGSGESPFFAAGAPTHPNLFDPEKVTYAYLNPNSGALDTSNTAWFTTDWLDIGGKAYLYCQRIHADGAVEVYVNRVAFYGADKAFISGCNLQQTAVAIPENAKFVRCCWGISSCNVQGYPYNIRFHFVGTAEDAAAASLPFAYYGAGIEGGLKPKFLPLLEHSPLRGKHLVVFGDSLMDVYGGHTLHKLPYNGDFSEDNKPLVKLCYEFGMTLDNRARAGSNISTHVTTGYTEVNGCAMLDAYISEVEAGTAQAPDYLLVAFGTNEYAANAGTADSTDRESFAGAMKYFIDTLRHKFPGCVFGFVLPPQCDWSVANVTYKDPAKAREAALAVLAQDGYAVPYIDMWTDSGILASMASDGVHVNKEGAGQLLYYHALRRFLLGL